MRRLGVLALLSVAAALCSLPATASAAGIISSLSLSPDSVRDGATSTGTVTLAFPDSVPNTVVLVSSDTAVATVPATTVIPAGALSVSFPITTNAAAPPEIVQIMAAVQNVPRTANLSVNAAAPPGPTLASVSLIPASLTGGSASTGTVRFTGVTDGADVQLSSSNPAVAQVPADTVVNGGASSGAFAVSTSPVSATTTVTITASWFGVTRTTTLKVTPGAPAAPDKVAIKKATWKARLLTIEATSTNPNAILSVFSQTGDFMFTLTNNGGGKFSDQRGFIFNPEVISVRSNFGGSATARLTS
jgi:hypothetical protein